MGGVPPRARHRAAPHEVLHERRAERLRRRVRAVHVRGRGSERLRLETRGRLRAPRVRARGAVPPLLVLVAVQDRRGDGGGRQRVRGGLPRAGSARVRPELPRGVHRVVVYGGRQRVRGAGKVETGLGEHGGYQLEDLGAVSVLELPVRARELAGARRERDRARVEHVHVLGLAQARGGDGREEVK
eukprot:28262-Pelagococcus_subviridis.AAC.4